jgi:hypothetical protein
MATKKQPLIKPLESYTGLPAETVVTRGTTVYTGLKDNPNFTTPPPPVDLATFKQNLDTLTTLNTEAKDGSKKVIAQQHKQLALVIKELRMLGRYVEVTSNGDMAIFKSSGFDPASTAKTPPQPTAKPVIQQIKHGPNMGQLTVHLKPSPKAGAYQMRYGSTINGAPPVQWITQEFKSVKPPVILSGLTPGTVYAVQVRALGTLGWSDWTDSDTCMCV